MPMIYMCVCAYSYVCYIYILIRNVFTDGCMHTQTLTHRSSNTEKCIFTNDAMLCLKLTCLFIFYDEGENILEHFNQVKNTLSH